MFPSSDAMYVMLPYQHIFSLRSSSISVIEYSGNAKKSYTYLSIYLSIYLSLYI